jgi:hypothetical protein
MRVPRVPTVPVVSIISGTPGTFETIGTIGTVRLTCAPKDLPIAVADRLITFSNIENVGHAHVLAFEKLALRPRASAVELEVALLFEVPFGSGMQRNIQLAGFTAVTELTHRHGSFVEVIHRNLLVAEIYCFSHMIGDGGR